MGWSATKVYAMILKYGFPAYRSSAKVPGGIAWQTSVDSVENWIRDQQEASYRYLAATKTGRNHTYTRRHYARHAKTYNRTPLIDNDPKSEQS